MASDARQWCEIVIPCYNEGARLQGGRFLEFLREHEGIRFLFVNDGSRDNTMEVLREIQKNGGERILVLDIERNGGKAEAVRAGMLRAIQEPEVAYVGFWDADLATPLSTIPVSVAFLAANEQLQMVFGSRVRLLGHNIHRRAVRHYLGRVFASVVSVLLRLPIYDTQCGAKLFRMTPELSTVLDAKFLSRWVFDVEILARYIDLHHGDSAFLRDSIYEHPLDSWEDVAGSKVGPGAFFKAFFDVLRIYRMYLRPGKRTRRLKAPGSDNQAPCRQ